MSDTKVKDIISTNKKAAFSYFIVNKYTAGVILSGTEVKAVRTGKVSMSDSYCVFKNNELWVKNIHISEYKKGSHYNHEVKRARKLLLHRRELRKLHSRVKEKGFAIVPTEVFISERNYIKITIALVKGKKLFDKRHSIKEKDQKRELAREKTNRYLD